VSAFNDSNERSLNWLRVSSLMAQCMFLCNCLPLVATGIGVYQAAKDEVKLPLVLIQPKPYSQDNANVYG